MPRRDEVAAREGARCGAGGRGRRVRGLDRAAAARDHPRDAAPAELAAPLDGLRVGLLSDLHGGAPHAGPGAIARAVRRLNEEAPDAILLLGDFIDAHPLWGGRIEPGAIAHELAKLRAPLGVFAVLGNHDWKQAGDRMWRALRNEGIEVLENRALQAGDLYVAGLADLRSAAPTSRARWPASRAGAPWSCSPTTRTCSRTSRTASR